MKKFFSLIALSSLLYSCGFQVIYKERDKEVETSYIEELATVRIQKERTRLGQRMKSNLYGVLNPDSLKAEPKYFLILNTATAASPTYITTTGASGRSRAMLTVRYEMKSLKNGVTISTGDTTVNDNYDMSANRYATYKASTFVEMNLTKVAAQNIRNSIVNDLVELRRKCVEKDANDDVDPLLCEAL